MGFIRSAAPIVAVTLSFPVFVLAACLARFGELPNLFPL